MQAWLESVAGPDYATALMWTIFALIGLLVLLVIIRIVRGLTFGTFVSGGKNRKTRLAVMDATAVDSQRRLVLVRRDDIEHLILIGGPTDVVVEQNIRLLPPARRPAQDEPGDVIQIAAAQPIPVPPAPAPQVAAKPPAPRPATTPAAAVSPTPPAPVRPSPAPYQPAPEPRYSPQVTPVTQPRPAPTSYQSTPPAPAVPDVDTTTAGGVRTLRPVSPVAPTVPAPQVSPQQQPSVQQFSVDPVVRTPSPSPIVAHDLDDALVAELNEKLDTSGSQSIADAAERSLDEEMSKLLGELSNRKA